MANERGDIMQDKLWEVHVFGSIPQVLDEIRAPTHQAAVQAALDLIISRLAITAYPRHPEPLAPKEPPTP
jgi:hypothetical protein